MLSNAENAIKLVSKCAGNDNNTAVASGPHLAHRQEIGFSREQCHVVNNLEFVVDAIRPLPQVCSTLTLLIKSQSNIIFDKKILSVLPSSSSVRPSPSPARPKIALLQSFLSLQRYPLPPLRRGWTVPSLRVLSSD